MIKVDISNVWGELSLPDLLAVEKEVAAAHMTLTEQTGPGNDFLGWLDLPVEEPTEEMLRVQAAADRIRETSDVFVVIGIGGSYLGPRAAIELMQGCNHNIGKGKGNPQIYFAGNGLSTRAWNELQRLLEGKDFSIAIISKSGTTTEPAIATGMSCAVCWRARISPSPLSPSPALPPSLPSQPGPCAGCWSASMAPTAPRSASTPSPIPARVLCVRWLPKRAGKPL